MRVLFSLILINTSLSFFGQGIEQQDLEGCWEVTQIDNKIFKGGVITFFEFTNEQVLFSKTKDNKSHGVLNTKTLIGKYKIENNMLIIEEKPNSYRLSYKENKDQKIQLVIEELTSINKKIIQTSYLIKWTKQ